jgi:hypothetical protein
MITIANKLEVLPGNVVRVPGCEPTSSFTSVTLGVNQKCNASVVTLQEALEAIPGATIERQFNPMRLYLVLPEGPPNRFGCENTTSVEDFYQRLRDIVPDDQPISSPLPSARPGPCDAFPLKRC